MSTKKIVSLSLSLIALSACKPAPVTHRSSAFAHVEELRSFEFTPETNITFRNSVLFLWPADMKGEKGVKTAQRAIELGKIVLDQNNKTRPLTQYLPSVLELCADECAEIEAKIRGQIFEKLTPVYTSLQEHERALRAELRKETPDKDFVRVRKDNVADLRNLLSQRQGEVLVGPDLASADEQKQFLKHEVATVLLEMRDIEFQATIATEELTEVVDFYEKRPSLQIRGRPDGSLRLDMKDWALDFKGKNKATIFTTENDPKKMPIQNVRYFPVGGKLAFDAIVLATDPGTPGKELSRYHFEVARVKYQDTDRTGNTYFAGKVVFTTAEGEKREGVFQFSDETAE